MLLDLINTAQRATLARPLWLGGVASASGGAGGPPGGFSGWLPQKRVAYDTSELAASGLPVSGISLLDNLNHIRYRLNTLELASGGTGGHIILYSGTAFPSEPKLNFLGNITVVDDPANSRTNITVTGGGGGASGIADITPAIARTWFLSGNGGGGDGGSSSVVNYSQTVLSTGWVLDNNTWTYSSAYVFTVPGDQTALLKKGIRIRWKQGGNFKYGIVLSSAYTSVTTVNIIVNSSHSFDNAAITNNAYSSLDNPDDWPGWFSYTPTFSGWSGTPPYDVAEFNVTGHTCFVNVAGILGTGSTSSGAFYVSTPVTGTAKSRAALVQVRNNNASDPDGYVELSTDFNTFWCSRGSDLAWSLVAQNKGGSFQIFYRI